MNKKIIIISSIIIVIILVFLLLLFSNKENINKTRKNTLTLENESIEVINHEVIIEGTVVNSSKENIDLKDIDIIVMDSNNKEVLRVASKIDKTLIPGESIIVSSQTKANLDNNQTYKLKIDY